MYVIYGNIYHQYTPNVTIYISYMDPVGYNILFHFLFPTYFGTGPGKQDIDLLPSLGLISVVAPPHLRLPSGND